METCVLKVFIFVSLCRVLYQYNVVIVVCVCIHTYLSNMAFFFFRFCYFSSFPRLVTVNIFKCLHNGPSSECTIVNSPPIVGHLFASVCRHEQCCDEYLGVHFQ